MALDTLMTAALLAVGLRVFLHRPGARRAGTQWTLAWLLPPALFHGPVRDTLALATSTWC